MYHATRDYGRKGSVMSAISAIDIALWDLAGKHYGVPVHRLLGGAFRKRVQPYATGFYRITAGRGGASGEEAQQHLESGFRLMKLKLGFGVSDDIEVLRAVAQAVQGKGVTLMVDTNHATAAEALRLGYVLDIMQPVRVVDGWVPIPDGPGLGIAVRPETVARYRVA